MRPSVIAGSTLVACVRRVALGLLALVLMAACVGGDSPAWPSDRPTVPTPAAVEARFAAIAANADQSALSILNLNRLSSDSIAHSVDLVVAGALEAALRQSPRREVAAHSPRS